MDKSLTSLDWALVRAFLIVAETGSLSAAARRLGASQPTLGRQIRQLETALGQTLFNRQPKGLALTENGRALMPGAQKMQTAMHEITLTAAGQETGLAGPVRITASESVSLYILPPILAKLRAEAPGISVDIVPSDSTENLLFREADIALRMYRPKQLELVGRHLGDIRLGIFASRAYLDRAGRPETVRDLFDHPIIGYDRNEEIIRELQARGFPATREWFAFRCDSHTVNWELVRAGCGIGFGQAGVAEADPEVEEIPIDVNLPVLPVWLATHQALRHSPRIALVWDALAEGMAPHLV
ncbi:LysR family transcriptional regulator [Roseovarius indicus]|uniref:CysJI operon transcriptional activator n=1 Tax=Roseovarius indicus TaxID=540747 RepID=A0A0T5P8V3_9RHOB|nr:LysR family transcriptional regulator [Roseovarius indicus]KRS17675.1 LysR family transcriptional regulator [Roseovarius indicus]QEW24579.1 CysJI operon transcriptional activator [Roseovarius indicus]SFE26134.1 transcriptional regulator, LysR family [Roseovarius indicus]